MLSSAEHLGSTMSLFSLSGTQVQWLFDYTNHSSPVVPHGHSTISGKVTMKFCLAISYWGGALSSQKGGDTGIGFCSRQL
jgi:hypothetical protein